MYTIKLLLVLAEETLKKESSWCLVFNKRSVSKNTNQNVYFYCCLYKNTHHAVSGKI